VRELSPHTPGWLASVVDRALAFAPKDRFPNALAMQSALREHASIEFPVFPVSAPGAAGPHVSSPFTPPGLTPLSLPRAQSSPSFGEGATLAAPSTDKPAVSSGGGTFASVQAVARSAQEAAPKPRSSRTLVALIAAGVAVVTAAVWLLRPSAPVVDAGVALGTAAAAPPSVTPPAVTPPAVTPPPVETAAQVEPPPSASAAPAASVAKPVVVAGKKPPRPPKPPHGKNPPDKPENLFDIRH
jgi:hypothetical protein